MAFALFCTVHVSNNGPLNAYLEVILQLSTHNGRCQNKILESEVRYNVLVIINLSMLT